MIEGIEPLLNRATARHLIFWASVVLYAVLSSSMQYYSGYVQIIEFHSMMILIQVIVAYVSIYLLMPRFLMNKQVVLFIFFLLLLLYVLYALYNLWIIHYYDVKYYEFYNSIGKNRSLKPFWVRFVDVPVVLSKFIKFVTPAVMLQMVISFSDRQQVLRLSEQKKEAELSALKNQLNPHFLFNTLNNLYALAIEKSDKTPEVIERLSEMLDYMLYRCNETFVLASKEIALIENYLALEKIRYGKRVEIAFDHHISEGACIGPLILLTFIENAFKHGVSQALKDAKVRISMKEQHGQLVFSVFNTVPPSAKAISSPKQEALGLKNVRQQLELLYPGKHVLRIEENSDSYSITLTVPV